MTDAQRERVIAGFSYYPGYAIRFGSIPFEINSSSTRMDLEVVAEDGTPLPFADVEQEKVRDAQVIVFVYDINDPAPPISDGTNSNVLFGGAVGGVVHTELGHCVLELKGLLSQGYALIGQTRSPVCRRQLGDQFINLTTGVPGCPIHIKPFETSPWVATTTITSISEFGFTVAAHDKTWAATVDRAKNGMVVFDGGEFDGDAREIRANPSATVFSIFTPMPAVEVGQSVHIVPGCNKSMDDHLYFHGAGKPAYIDGSGPAGDARWFDAEPYAAIPEVPGEQMMEETGLALVKGTDNSAAGQVWTTVDPDGRSFWVENKTVPNTFNAWAITDTLEGKVYCEFKVKDYGAGTGVMVLGVRGVNPDDYTNDWINNLCSVELSIGPPEANIITENYSGMQPAGVTPNGTAGDDIVMVAVDADAQKIWLGLNGDWLDGDPATGNNPTYSGSYGTRSQYRFEVELCRKNQEVKAAFRSEHLTYEVPEGFRPSPAADDDE